MIRKFAAALFAVSTLSSSVAMALGLGEAKVTSTLNQPLNAEIELVSVRDLSAAEILPALASREDFAKAGLERPYFLSDLKFHVVFKDANKAVIKLTSQKPVREPFLNFLVEVVWPNGRLLREYALLIDPPMFTSEPAVAVTPATVPAQPAPVVRRDPTPQTVASASMYSASMQVSPGGERRKVRTSGTDTLWNIAQQNRPSSRVTTQQTMLAIQDLNPQAFIDGNINLLKSGQVLQMPTLEDVEKRSHEQAVAQVRAQNRAFAEKQALSGRQIDATGRSAAPAPAQAPASDSVLKIVAADGSSQDNAGQATGGKSGTADGKGGSSEVQLDLALEQLDKTTRENRELQSRLQELESQLETLQRLVSLKDDQLALLQAQTGLADEAQSQSAQPVTAAEVSGESEVAVAQETQQSEAVSESVAAEIEQEAAKVEAQADDQALQAEAAAQPEAEVVQSAPVQPVPPATPVALPEPPATSFLEEVLSNPLYKGIAGGSAILLLIILWLASRHNANKEKQFQQQLAAAGGAPVDDDEVVDLGQSDRRDNAGAVAAGVGLGALAAVAGTQDGENSDVLAEAEAYMAYGRLEQAAQLLEDELENQPGRTDVRLKLLEVYSQSGNEEAFERHFEVLEASGDAEALSQAQDLRAALAGNGEPELSLDDLENELLSGSSSYSTKHSEASQAEDELSDAFAELDSKELEQAAQGLEEQDPEEEEVESVSSEAEEVLGADKADAPIEFEVEAKAEQPAVETDDLDIDFDLSELDLDSLDESDSKAAAQPEGEKAAASSDLELMDFDLDTLDETPAESVESLEANAGLELEPLAEKVAAEETEVVEELGADFGEMSFEEEPVLESSDAGLDLELAGDDVLASELATEEAVVELEAPELDMSDDEVAELLDASAESLADEIQETVEDVAELDDELPVLSDEDLESLASTPEALVQDDEEAPAAAADLGEEDFDFLAGTDEAATKLDLARAYIDMGDLEGARDILEEVTKEGNEQQQQEAAALLKTLD